MIDDTVDSARMHARQQVDLVLATPVDPEEATQFKRDHWGMTPGAVADAMQMDAQLGDVTYGE
jgi:hypothetical protein